MVRNLPRRLTQKAFLQELERTGFSGHYDFCYLPCSFESGAGRGYAFVNFLTEQMCERFVSEWEGTRRFSLSEDDPPLVITEASTQGFARNVAKWTAPRMNRVRNPNLRPFIGDRQKAAKTQGSSLKLQCPKSQHQPPLQRTVQPKSAPSKPRPTGKPVQAHTQPELQPQLQMLMQLPQPQLLQLMRQVALQQPNTVRTHAKSEKETRVVVSLSTLSARPTAPTSET
mmetsp:Transcript_16660/g.45098  ORF Transcript_16660/g.45098 Transcript_16660/m.45098 type:complete len:227 (-) Transcript_16660:20-700(-)